jgi:hypothetical protein
MAFAEAVMALGAGQSSGLVASDIWTLLVGQTPSFTVSFSETFSAASAGIMAMPAWIAFGAVGVAMVQLCRKRRDRRRRLRTIR